MRRLEDILSVEGIVIRHVPKESVFMWGYRDGDEERLKENEEIVQRDGRRFRRETKQNELAGYVVTCDKSQGSIVRFSKKTDGFGSTVEEAYDDFVKKRGCNE